MFEQLGEGALLTLFSESLRMLSHPSTLASDLAQPLGQRPGPKLFNLRVLVDSKPLRPH